MINLALSIIALGFLTIYVFGWRKTGVETMGAPIWWNDWRPLHGALYGIAAYQMWNGMNESAGKVILLDTIIGLIAFLLHYYG